MRLDDLITRWRNNNVETCAVLRDTTKTEHEALTDGIAMIENWTTAMATPYEGLELIKSKVKSENKQKGGDSGKKSNQPQQPPQPLQPPFQPAYQPPIQQERQNITRNYHLDSKAPVFDGKGNIVEWLFTIRD